jgi:hypothetical protein
MADLFFIMLRGLELRVAENMMGVLCVKDFVTCLGW